MDNFLLLFPRRWVDLLQTPAEGDAKNDRKTLDDEKPLPPAGTVVLPTTAGSILIAPPRWKWHSDGEEAVTLVRRRLALIIFFDCMVR